jgi:endonuclease/exonuclease/phosphatase family metal-dependent hydrolase
MLYTNRELDRAFDFISKSDFDIFCLQEVPEIFLSRLKKLPLQIAYRVDTEKFSQSESVTMFNVILSRHQIIAQNEISFPNYEQLPLRTRILMDRMPLKLFSRARNRGGIYADIMIQKISLRVFCLHLTLMHPELRLKEFETALAKQNISQPTIVCGDFNILEKPHITPLNWLLGGSIADALFYSRERKQIEKHFSEHKLTNALSGKITHPLSRSQLDHILVSNLFSIKKAEVIPDRYGSDHHPISVEIE